LKAHSQNHGTRHRRRWPAAAVLGAAALLGAAWLARIDFSRKISLDVLDLLPSGERSPEMGIVRQLASEAEARVMLFVVTDAAGAAAQDGAARRFAEELARQPVFAEALALEDPAPIDALGRELFDHRFTLLFPLWLRERSAAYAAAGGDSVRFSEWLAADAAARLDRFLATPGATAFQDALPADPLLLIPGAMDRAKGGLALIQPPAGSAIAAPSHVWARIAASPLREEGQAPVFKAIERALGSTRGEYPGANVAYTGVNLFAAASKARIRLELAWLNVLSIVAVCAVALVFIRKARRALHLAPPVLLAVLGAWVCTTAAFERVHILVFVLGSLLTGVAVDYGFYLFMQAPAGPGEDYWAKVRRLRKPLLSSCFTTVAGFALLLFSELPLIRQLGLFVAAGLLCALAGAIVYFSMLDDAFLEARRFPGFRGPGSGTRRMVRRVLIALWIAALPGLLLVKWRDDVRDLEIPAPAMQQEDARIRALFEGSPEQAVYLTHGRSLSEARDALERFEGWLRAAGSGEEFASLGAVVPTETWHAEALRFARENPEFPAQLRSALEKAGFDAGAFDPFFTAYASFTAHASGADLEAAVQSLHASLTGPLSLLLHVGRPLSWFVTLANRAPAGTPPPGTRTVNTDQLQSLNLVLERYRQSALRISLAGLAIVGAGVFLAYGLRDGARIFSIPCGAALGLFGLFGWLGLPLNMFHVLGAFLGVCLTHNYSIFSATSAYRREPPPVSVRLSALCAASSFGVLALSGIPVVHALGETVAMMVLTALLVIEFEHFTPIANK
jgi:predicted exporter